MLGFDGGTPRPCGLVHRGGRPGAGPGYLLDLVHVAWAAAAAMFIMRPDPGLLTSRAIGRTVATFAGVVAAALLLRRGPAETALAVVTVAAIAAMIAVRTSRWYIAPAGSGIIVMLVSGAAGTRVLDVTFTERITETALGAGLAFFFGVAIPAGMRWLTRRHPTNQAGHATVPPAASWPSTVSHHRLSKLPARSQRTTKAGWQNDHVRCLPILMADQQGDPGWQAQPHDLPVHARRPSTTAQPAIPSATTPSSHQAPQSVLAASPANTAIAR